MKSIVSITLLVTFAACAAGKKKPSEPKQPEEPVGVPTPVPAKKEQKTIQPAVEGPALVPYEAPPAHEGDITLRATAVRDGGPKTADDGARFEAAVTVGVGNGVSLGVAHTLRITELPDVDEDSPEEQHESTFKGGNEDLRLSIGWRGEPTDGVVVRLLADAWLPTHADMFDVDHPDERARLSGTLALRVHDDGWFWLAPAIEGTRDEPRTFEGGLEIGGAAAVRKHILLAARAGAHERYLEDADDLLIGFGRLQVAWRCERMFYLLEGEVGDRSRGYGQLTLSVGLRTKLW